MKKNKKLGNLPALRQLFCQFFIRGCHEIWTILGLVKKKLYFLKIADNIMIRSEFKMKSREKKANRNCSS